MSALDPVAVAQATRYFDSWLGFRQRTGHIPGVQAAVLAGDEMIAEMAHGLADIASNTPLTTQHLFRIASHSKTFTSTAVMQLVERGAVRLDDAAATWLPYLAGTGLASATVRELLSHAAGVTRDGTASDHWALAVPFPDAAGLQAMVTEAGADVLARNERFKYSNVGFSMLGAIIEAVTGQSYDDYVIEHIVEPLGLTRSGPDLPAEREHECVTGYTSLDFGDVRVPIGRVDANAMASATGWYSTAGEVVRYAAAHFFGDERLVSDESKRIMQRTEWAVGGTPTSYGLGWGISTIGTRRVIGHGGGYPGHITRTFFDPVDRLAVSVLTNAIDGPAMGLATAAIGLIDLALSETPDPSPFVSTATFAGRYANLWSVFDIVELGGRLHMIDPTSPDPLQSLPRLEVVDADTVRFADAPGYASPGESLRFERDDAGAVVAVRGAGTSWPYDVVVAATDTAVATGARITVGHPLIDPT